MYYANPCFVEVYRDEISQEENFSRLQAFAEETRNDQSLGNFILLNRSRYDVSPTLTVLGCTLWSALNENDLDILSWSLTDFRRIQSFDPTAYNNLHDTDREWLNATVEEIAKAEPERKVVIFTHHAPTVMDTGDPKYLGQPTNSAFATEMTLQKCWASGTVVMWAFGHTHWCCDFVRDGIRVYSNQRGYGDGGLGYKVSKIVEV